MNSIRKLGPTFLLSLFALWTCLPAQASQCEELLTDLSFNRGEETALTRYYRDHSRIPKLSHEEMLKIADGIEAEEAGILKEVLTSPRSSTVLSRLEKELDTGSLHASDFFWDKDNLMNKERELLRTLFASSSMTKASEISYPFSHAFYEKIAEVFTEIATEENASAVESIAAHRSTITALQKKIVNGSLDLGIRGARKYVGRGLPLEDLIQSANMGLMGAARKFEAKMGFQFSTYAMHGIHAEVGRMVMNDGRNIRLPTHFQEKLRKMSIANNELRKQLKREPTPKETAAKLQISETELTEMTQSALAITSLDRPLKSDNDANLGDFLSDKEDLGQDENVDRMDAIRKVRGALSGLNERERFVIESLFALYDQPELQTLEEIGEKLGLTRGRVWQIKGQALAKLKRSLKAISPKP